jgi:hypothetical protein
VLSRSALGLVSQVIVQPHLVDLIEMGFEPVDVGFFLEQDQFEEFTDPTIADFDRQAKLIPVCLNGDIVKCLGSAFIVRVPGGHIVRLPPLPRPRDGQKSDAPEAVAHLWSFRAFCGTMTPRC